MSPYDNVTVIIPQSEFNDVQTAAEANEVLRKHGINCAARYTVDYDENMDIKVKQRYGDLLPKPEELEVG